MKDRKAIIFIASAFLIACLALALYFFLKKPVKISIPVIDEEKR